MPDSPKGGVIVFLGEGNPDELIAARDAGETRISQDRQIGFANCLQFLHGNIWAPQKYRSRTADGKNYYYGAKGFISCRDAFNGMLLWRLKGYWNPKPAKKDGGIYMWVLRSTCHLGHGTEELRFGPFAHGKVPSLKGFYDFAAGSFEYVSGPPKFVGGQPYPGAS